METNIAFCGAGFLGIYHIGVVSCLKTHAKKLLDNVNKYGGCSAGALAACMLLCGIEMEACVQFVMNQACKVHRSPLGPMSKSFDICSHIRRSCTKYLPLDAYEKASGKLFISLTRMRDLQNVIVSEYSCNEDLIDALICTCFIPVFCGMVAPKFQGVAYIDGGLTDNLPQHFEGTTITVSPFGGENDICPDDRHKSSSQFAFKNTNMQFSCHNLYRMTRAMFPPDNEVLIKMCQEGFNDALKYLFTTYSDYLTVDDSIQFTLAECLLGNQKDKKDDVTDRIQNDASTLGAKKDYVIVRIQNGASTLGAENGDVTGGIQSGASTLDAENGDVTGGIQSGAFTLGAENDESAASMNEAEQIYATYKSLRNVILPTELNKILIKTKEDLDNDKMNWYFLQMFITIMSNWTRKPCKYTSTYVLNFSKRMLAGLLPKIQWIGSKNNYTQRIINLVKKGLDAYKETTLFEWHPSIKGKDKLNIQLSKNRLKSFGDGLKIVPKPKASLKKVTFHDDPNCSGYQTAVEDIHDENELEEGQEHVEMDIEVMDQDILYFSTPVLNPSQDNLMSVEEDLIGYGDDANETDEDQNEAGEEFDEGEDEARSFSSSLKDVLARGVGYVYTKSLGLE